MIEGFPYTSFPSGWFQIAWSPDIRTGQTIALSFFGKELVAYRGESGNVHVMDAHCRHMGAHLAFGGTIDGDNIRCPFHGWCWSPDGRNLEIPYSRRTRLNITQQVYPCIERDGLVLAWYDAEDNDPTWSPPDFLAEYGNGLEFFDIAVEGTGADRLRMQPQMMVDNSVDFPHLVYTHRWVGESKLEDFRADGHVFLSKMSGSISTKKGVAPMDVTQYLYGMGLIFAPIDGLRYTVNVVGTTPIDEDYSQVFISTFVSCPAGMDASKPDNLAKAICHAQREEVIGKNGLGDRKIWENQHYVSHQPLPPEEHAGVKAVREWSQQFYPRAEAHSHA